jgi:hypothetical protein
MVAFLKGRVVATLFAIAIAVGMTSRAHADFSVQFVVDAASVQVDDGGAGDADGVVNNQILVLSQVVGAYTFNVSLTTTNTPGGGIAFVNHGTNEITGTGAATIQIIASANDFTSPVTPPALQAISGSTSQYLPGSVDGNTADVSYTAHVDETNTLFGTATLVGSDGPQTIVAPGGNANLLDNQLVNSLTGPYALTLTLQAVLNSGGTNNIDLDGVVQLTPLAVVPEPGTAALLIAGLPFLGAYARRRFRGVKA